MIETKRLKIQPLTYAQLLLYIKNDHSLERELSLNQTQREISPRLSEAMTKNILPKVADPKMNFHYFTLWSAILKTENKMVADLCFKGEPNDAGEIEIGYGTYPAFRQNGYISEAIGGLISWAKQQKNVKALTAQTDPKNFASIKALEKNGFVKQKEEQENIQWKLTF